jgi:hypothetical protein
MDGFASTSRLHLILLLPQLDRTTACLGVETRDVIAANRPQHGVITPYPARRQFEIILLLEQDADAVPKYHENHSPIAGRGAIGHRPSDRLSIAKGKASVQEQRCDAK